MRDARLTGYCDSCGTIQSFAVIAPVKLERYERVEYETYGALPTALELDCGHIRQLVVRVAA